MHVMHADDEVSLIRRMTEQCNRRGGLNLGQGLCTLPPPLSLVRAAQQAISEGYYSYAPAEGLPELRTMLAGKLRAFNAIEADPCEEILVTAGATGGYVAALQAICQPGDAVILPEPFYGYHRLLACQSGLDIRTIEFSTEGPEALHRQLAARSDLATARVMVICTPSNPSGRILSAEELAVIAAWAEAHAIWLVTDETYEHYVYNGQRHVSPASVVGRGGRIVSIFSFSKTFSVPGWRLGYVVAPASVMRQLVTVHDRYYICPPAPFQRAGLAALELGPNYYRALADAFAERRDLLCNALASTVIRVTPPMAAYYAWADVSALGVESSLAAAMHILEVAGVACVPGSWFYASPAGERWVRFCFAVERADLEEAARRLVDHFALAKATCAPAC